MIASLPASAEISNPTRVLRKPASTDMTGGTGTTLTLSGFVDYAGSASNKVEIWMLKDANQDSDGTAGNTTPSSKWQLVKTVTPGTTPNGSGQYAWTSGSFVPCTAGNPCWPNGGTIRFRARAKVGNAYSWLHVVDANGNVSSNEQLILGSTSRDPTTGTPFFDAGQPGHFYPFYLGARVVDDADGPAGETQQYYDSVNINTSGSTKLSSLTTVTAFRNRYFGPISGPASCVSISTPETVATYYNAGDLGIGREMHCINNECTQETACYVRNFAPLNGNVPIFDDFNGSKTAHANNQDFATVAMVERRWTADPNRMLFVVYNDVNAITAGPVQLDSKGFNKFNPGNCLACHGAGTYNKTANSTTGAKFLPFDVQSFKFFSTTASNPLSRAQQEDEFKKLNYIMYFSKLGDVPGAKPTIDAWYAGNSATFINDAIPANWTQIYLPPFVNYGGPELYKKVIGPNCRTCHISQNGLSFASENDFRSFSSLIVPDVCSLTKRMPHAEQTQRNFWKTGGRAALLDRLASPAKCLANTNQVPILD